MSLNSKFKLFIVESGSTDGAAEHCDHLTRYINKDVEVIHTEKEGPLKAYNLIFEKAKKEKCDLLITQTDVIFPRLYKRDWLAMMNDFSQSKEIGAVTCLNGGGVSGPDYIDGLKWLGGWCTYYPHRTLEQIGGYDENYPNGFGVDIDHSYAIYKAGFRIAIMDYWVDHHMMNERAHDKDSNTEQMKQESAKYFNLKWKI